MEAREDGEPLANRIPEGVRDVIGKRMTRLSATCNEVLSIASVVRREFRLSVLQRVSEAGEGELLAALEEATSAAVVEQLRGISIRAPGSPWTWSPRDPDGRKLVKECDPAIAPLRYLVYDSRVFLSGVTAELPTLLDQLADILPRIEGSLADAGSSRDHAVRVSFFLQRSPELEGLKKLFQQAAKMEIPETEYAFVDGYSTVGKLIDIEVTAGTSP